MIHTDVLARWQEAHRYARDDRFFFTLPTIKKNETILDFHFSENALLIWVMCWKTRKNQSISLLNSYLRKTWGEDKFCPHPPSRVRVNNDEKAYMTFSWISYLRDIAHLPYRPGKMESGVGDPPFSRQVAIVHPAMEPEHFPEKRHTFSGHGLPSIVVTSKYSAQ